LILKQLNPLMSIEKANPEHFSSQNIILPPFSLRAFSNQAMTGAKNQMSGLPLTFNPIPLFSNATRQTPRPGPKGKKDNVRAYSLSFASFLLIHF
jgi:hypothetical protein